MVLPGLNAVLRYVENGEVNAYAVTYPVLVRPNVSSLNFLWQSHAQSQIGYEAGLDVEGEGKELLSVGLNVPSSGFIPTHLAPLVVNLACGAEASGEYQVTFHLRYNWPSEGAPTQLSLRRRKICVPRLAPQLRPHQDAELKALATDTGEHVRAVEVFYIAMGCVVGFVIVVASLIIAYFIRLKKPASSPNPMMVRSGYVAQSEPFLRPHSPSAYSKYCTQLSSPHFSGGSLF